MKVLVISGEVWKDSTNGGNVLSNIFEKTGFEFAQIYCNPGTPENHLCRHYYQMTDSMVIKNFLSHRPIGNAFNIDDLQRDKTELSSAIEQPNNKFYTFFHNHRFNIFYIAKSFIWNTSNWKNDRLEQFVLEFSPDIIFAPCYGNTFMLRLTRYVVNLTGKKVISYISDDSYTLKQFRFSPLFWLERFFVRHQLCKTFSLYSLVYTMTEMQKQQCERDFGANIKILLKSVQLSEIPEKNTVCVPVHLVYAGGIYLNRWKTLSAVASALKDINRYGIKMVLDIYTGNEIPSKINKKLNDGVNSTVHSSISQTELAEIYHNSDIALHVESFDLKNRLAVRMSFSTKIVDCLASGCAVMAICDEKQGGFEYLKNEDAAICISDPAKIKGKLMELVNSPTYIIEYVKKARDCCRRNHDKNTITQMIKEDFEKYSR